MDSRTALSVVLPQSRFLAAALQTDSLKRSTTLNKLRKAVDSLPLGLNALYESTWRRINAQTEDEVSLATKAIIWLTYAERSLSIRELQHALAVSNEMGNFDEDDIAVEELIISVSCGLIVFDGQSRVVRLVREYLHLCIQSIDC
jgi:hypothetical protein